MTGRTVWLAKDAAWWGREWIVELGEEFGPVGPAVMDWLECHAKQQNHNGYVKTGFRALARGVFSDVVTVRDVVRRCVTVRALSDFEEDNGIIKCQITWWEADQEKALHANRQARYRGRLRDENVTSDVSRRSVTKVTNTEEDSIKEKKKERASRERSGKVDQTSPPTDFPEGLQPKLASVVAILHEGWQHRGGLEPQPRGVALAMMRDIAVDHEATARKLVQWLTTGNGQKAPCRDIAAYLGNWVDREPASSKPQLRVVDNSTQAAAPGKYTQAAKNNPYSVIPEAS